MNILFIETSIPPFRGGVERVTWLLRSYFLAHGHDVFLAFCLKDSEEVDARHKVRFEQHFTPEELLNALQPFVCDNAIDIIVSQHYFGASMCYALNQIRKVRGCKIIGCFHNNPKFEGYYPISIKTKIKEFIKRLLGCSQSNPNKSFYGICDKFVLLSESYKERMVNSYGLPDMNKLVSIHNPLSFEYTIQEIDLRTKQKIVLIVSRMEETQKNLKAALRIWKEVENDRRVSEWKLLLGGYEPDEKEILDYARDLSLSNFEFIGKVEDAQALYKKSLIFMMTSRFEGFGMTLTESLQNGCIPMAFDTYTALHDIIEDGYNGYIVPASDEAYYAGKLVDLMLDVDKRQSMGRNALACCKKFTLENIGAKWLELFGSLYQDNLGQ